MKKVIILSIFTSLLFTGCKDNKDNSIHLPSYGFTTYYGDVFQIGAKSELPIIYTSRDNYYAMVSSSGLVTAGKVGETDILLDNGEDAKTVKITVIPESNLYPEPYLAFGMSRFDLMARLGTPDAEDEGIVLYDGYSRDAPILVCLFDGANRLEGYAVLVKTSYSDELAVFLDERYLFLDEEDYVYYFLNGFPYETGPMLGVSASVFDADFWMVLYVPVTPAIRSNSAATDNSAMISRIKELMSKEE